MNDNAPEHVINNCWKLKSMLKSIKFCGRNKLVLPSHRYDDNLSTIQESRQATGNLRARLNFA